MAKIRHQRPTAFPSAAPAPVVNIAERRSKRDPLQPNRKIGIFVAVPSATGKVNYSIAMLFARLMASNAATECPFVFTVHMEIGKRPIDYARNCIVQTFLSESDCDWLVMIDDDQIAVDDFWKLCIVRDADVVGGLSPVWVGNMDHEAMLRVNNYGVDDKHHCYNLPPPPADLQQPYRVPIVGTGVIAVRRRVFAPKPRGVGDAPFYFTHTDDRKVQGGEDINFSVECNRAGFILAVHPQIWFDHMKEIPLRQIELYYQARKRMEAEGRQLTEAQRISIG